jgi:hypothetical protein
VETGTEDKRIGEKSKQKIIFKDIEIDRKRSIQKVRVKDTERGNAHRESDHYDKKYKKGITENNK